MSALSIPCNLPATLVVLDEKVLERIEALSHQAYKLAITDPDALRQADALYKQMRGPVKEIESNRKTLTAPLDMVKAAAIEAERSGIEPLTQACADLAKRIADAVAAENAKRAEAARLAEIERQRLQAEENARADAERARLQQEAIDNAPPGEPVEEVPVTAALPVAVAAPYVAPALKSSAQRNKTDWLLVIEDLAKVPCEIGGAVIRPLDEATCKRLMRAGAKIPGLRLDEVKGLAAKG